MDHRAERRSPRWTNGIAPAPAARTPLASDQLPAATRTPLLVRVEVNASDLVGDRLRALERSQLRRRMNVNVLRATPAAGLGLTSTSDNCVEPSPKLTLGRRAIGPPSSRASGPQPRRRGSHATHRPRGCYPSATATAAAGRKSTTFRAELVRTPAQAFRLHRARYRTPSPISYRVEAAGIEPASAVAPNRASTSVVRASSHPPEGSRTTCRRASHPEASHLRRLALPWCLARLLAPAPGSRAQPGSASPY